MVSIARGMFVPGHPDRGSNADRGIRPGNEADEHDQSKVLCGVPTEEVKGRYAEKGGGQGVERATNGLMNRVISQFRKAIGPAMGMDSFTDTVKNNDRFIHRVAQYRQDGCQERSVYFQMEEGEDPQYHEDIMANGYDS